MRPGIPGAASSSSRPAPGRGSQPAPQMPAGSMFGRPPAPSSSAAPAFPPGSFGAPNGFGSSQGFGAGFGDAFAAPGSSSSFGGFPSGPGLGGSGFGQPSSEGAFGFNGAGPFSASQGFGAPSQSYSSAAQQSPPGYGSDVRGPAAVGNGTHFNGFGGQFDGASIGGQSDQPSGRYFSDADLSSAFSGMQPFGGFNLQTQNVHPPLIIKAIKIGYLAAGGFPGAPSFRPPPTGSSPRGQSEGLLVILLPLM